MKNIRLDHLPIIPLSIFLIFIVSAAAYLPFAHRLGYYNDDWYLIYSGFSQGITVFKQIFDIDRPFRGLFVGWMFHLFGVNAPLYSYTAYLVRSLGALGVVWITRMVWPKEKLTALILGLTFAIYPGFLDQPNAIDYQSHIWAFSLMIGSIAFSLRTMLPGLPRWQRIVMVVLSIISQVVGLLLMEYYIGMEGLRVLLILVMSTHLVQDGWRERFGIFMRSWLPSLAGAAGFMVWRQLIFVNQRGATDIQAMFNQFVNAPVTEGLWMITRMMQDLLNVTLMAWTVPVYDLVFSLRLKPFLLVTMLSVVTGFATWIVLRMADNIQRNNLPPNESPNGKATIEMAFVGLLSMGAALVPVHLGGRQVIFESFSRFTLTASIGAGLVLVSFWRAYFSASRLSLVLPVLLVVLGVMTHLANGINHIDRWELMRNFWWQVSWRVPQFTSGTVLAVDYAGYGAAEDYFIWGPANIIYATPGTQVAMELPILAATLDKRDLIKAIGQETEEFERRGIVSEKDFTNLLVLSMPTSASCVQTIDEDGEISNLNRIEVIALAPYSHIDRINVHDPLRTPPAPIFGAEPEHGWCYYFQTASLLRQRGDWDGVLHLGEEAIAQELSPSDGIEWLPFIQAYAYAGREDRLQKLAQTLLEVPFLTMQACMLAQNDPYQAKDRYPQGHERLIEVFCKTSG